MKTLPLDMNSTFQFWEKGITPYMQRAKGAFIRRTLLANVESESRLAKTGIFGPVSLVHAGAVEEALELVNRGPYGN
jgi:acyl-CoA reductase-like NAD-dependent aldehyde dehydrogenase